MKRRSKASRKAGRAERRKTATPKRSIPRKAVPGRLSTATGPETEIARLSRERDEALEQQKATAEVLRVISASPGDLKPVFQVMLANAVRICDAKFGNIYRCHDDAFHLVAAHNTPPLFAEQRARSAFCPGPKTVIGRAARTKQVTHVADLMAEEAYAERDPVAVASVELAGIRTLLCVPMLKENELIGMITIYRQEVRSFTGKQIELVQNFAAQAVIAVENTRLLNELRDSLQRQTATADVLKVISSSPGDLEPVFQAVLENATRICEAKFGTLFSFDGEKFCLATQYGTPEEFAEFQSRRGLFKPTPGSLLDEVMRTKRMNQTADNAAEPVPGDVTRLGGARSFVSVPMLKDNELVGAINIYRQEVRPFTDKQIALLENFSAQAVIAIENTRLLNELRGRTQELTEALEQRTATSEVLSAISSSPGELTSVFDTILANALRLCDADTGHVLRAEAGTLSVTAMRGGRAEYAQFWRERGPWRPAPHSAPAQAIEQKKPVQIADMYQTSDYAAGGQATVAAVELGGLRTVLMVPMMADEKAVGIIVIYRSVVRPFSGKQIELVENFAAQAVIAIENTRLFNELRQRTDDLSKSLEDLRTAQDRLVQTQKLASLGQLTAGIAHEIKNPLNFVNNFSGVSVELIDELQETLGRVTADDKTRGEITELADTLRDNLDKIVQHGKRADSIVKNMLLHSREGSGERRAVDVNAIVEESLNLAYHGARAEKQGFNVTLERSFDPAAGEIDVFPQEITRVLLNLISNGFYAATKRQGQESGNGFEPTISAATNSLGDRVEIRIRDNGIGIPPEVREKMFNPFFTTKPAGEGTGLGLSISHDIIVKQHSGSIEVDTEPGEFTEFRIILPRTSA